MQIPVAKVVTAAPATVQTSGEVDESETTNPDEVVAVALTGTEIVASGSAGNVIVCAAFETAKLCWTEGAAAKIALPA